MNGRKGTLVDDLNDFDGLCASMRPGKIVVITGEDGCGKTKLAMKVAHAFAPDVESTEVKPKYAYVLTPVKSSQTIMDAGLCKRHILVDDCPRMFVDGLLSRVRAVVRAYQLTMVVIDDFQSVTRQFGEDPSQNRQEVAEAIKALAEELQIPVVLVVADAHKVPCEYCQCNLQFLNELADYTDFCICLGRSEEPHAVSWAAGAVDRPQCRDPAHSCEGAGAEFPRGLRPLSASLYADGACAGTYANVGAFLDDGEEDSRETPLVVDSRLELVFALMGADENDRTSLEMLYDIFQGRYEEIPRDFGRAFEYLIRLQREDLKRIQNHPEEGRWALNHHGEHLLRDLVEKQDESDKWVDWEYSYVLGVCYENGWILEKDLKKSAEYYSKALSMGYKKAEDDLKGLVGV